MLNKHFFKSNKISVDGEYPRSLAIRDIMMLYPRNQFVDPRNEFDNRNASVN